MLPAVINWAKFERGDIVAPAIGEVISRGLGVPINIVSPPTPEERNRSLATGESHMCFISNTNYYDSLRGVYYDGTVFESWDPGFAPQRFRLMFAGFTVVGSAVVRANTDIYQIRDLKGKTVALANKYPSVAINALAGLAFGGLALTDIKVVNVGTFTTGLEMLVEGKVDAAYGSPTGLAAELAVKPPGLRWLPMPHDDNEAWQRFWKVRPFLEKAVYDKGLMEDKPLDMFKAEYMLVTMDFQGDEFVYKVTKAMHESYPRFKDKVVPLGTEQVNITRTLDLNNYKAVLVPYHSGLIRLARELELWAVRHDEYQAKALQDQEHWIGAWQAIRSK